MNVIMRNYYSIFEMYQALRSGLMDILDDADLSYQPGGDNPPLGVLCREIGETEQAYIDSFKTFTQDFSYRHPNAAQLEQSVADLKTWYAQLDTDLKTAVAALTDEEATTKKIQRGHNFQVPPRIQITIYTEALLIFYGKVTVYLRAMGKERPQQWQEWIG